MVGAERAADDRKGSRVAPLRRAGARGPGPEHGPRGAGSGEAGRDPAWPKRSEGWTLLLGAMSVDFTQVTKVSLPFIPESACACAHTVCGLSFHTPSGSSA